MSIFVFSTGALAPETETHFRERHFRSGWSVYETILCQRQLSTNVWLIPRIDVRGLRQLSRLYQQQMLDVWKHDNAAVKRWLPCISELVTLCKHTKGYDPHFLFYTEGMVASTERVFKFWPV